MSVQLLRSRQPAGELDQYVFAPAHGAGPIQLSKVWRKKRISVA
jgi:hypothetical protein